MSFSNGCSQAIQQSQPVCMAYAHGMSHGVSTMHRIGTLSADEEVPLLRLYSAWHCSMGQATPVSGSADAVGSAAALQPQPAGKAEPAPCKLGQEVLPAR